MGVNERLKAVPTSQLQAENLRKKNKITCDDSNCCFDIVDKEIILLISTNRKQNFVVFI